MKKHLVLAVALAAAALPALTYAKDHRQDQEAARALLLQGKILPLVRILAIGARAVPGNVVEVELKRHGSQFIYELKILARNGGLREIELDARTGKVLLIEVEDD